MIPEWKSLQGIAMARLEHGDIKGAIYSLIMALARATDSAGRQAVEKRLAGIEAGLRVRPTGGWVERDSASFTPLDPESSETPELSFVLEYVAGETRVPAGGIPYALEFVEGTGTLAHGSKTGADGSGQCDFFARDEPLSGFAVRLRFRFDAGGKAYFLRRPTALFFVPPPRNIVEIKVGSRIETLVEELEVLGISNRKALLAVAAKTKYPGWAIVPPATPSGSRFEGLFEPGRYILYKKDFAGIEPHMGPEQAEALALDNMNRIVAYLLRRGRDRFQKLERVKGLDAYQQIILASIVEKEAASNRDYGKVASVLYNRMQGGSRLGSCPTVEYALGYHRPFLTRQDISIDSPYNVYRRKGLPPTPICMFSDQALEAVTRPIESPYYYFVYDWTREQLSFARLYSEHLKNADEARDNYAERYGQDALYRVHHDKFYEN